MNEDILSHINEGRTAHTVLAWMDPVFKEVEKNLMDSLKSSFRCGKYTELLLACHVAQLCALEDLRVKIKSIAVRGDSAASDIQKEDDQN